MSSLKKPLFAFLVPGGLLFFAALALLRPHGLPPWVQGPVSAFPFIVLAFGLFFGWYLSSSRLILSFIVLSVADRSLALLPPMDQPIDSAHRVMFSALALLLPLNLMALSIMKEEAMSTWRGALRLAVVVIQPILVLWLAQPGQAWIAHSLQQPLLPILNTSWTELPQPALVAFSGAVLLIGIRFALNRKPFDSGIFWTVIASFVAVQGFHHGWMPTNFFSAAGFILFVTLLQASHQEIYRDELTGVPGKLAYDQAVAGLGKKYVVAVVGIDQLKQYANQRGRPVSEQVLCLVARQILAATGAGRVFRLAGEEFIVLYPRKAVTDTLVDLGAIRKSVEVTALYLRGRDRVWERGAAASLKATDEPLPVTVSIGVAETGIDKSTIELVTKAAYRALYEAKGEGGNRVKRGTIVAETKKIVPAHTGQIVAYHDFES
jgi:diguanylate cyclase (GGDEF)-like protein